MDETASKFTIYQSGTITERLPQFRLMDVSWC